MHTCIIPLPPPPTNRPRVVQLPKKGGGYRGALATPKPIKEWRAEWSDAIDEAAEACSAAEDRAEMAEVALGAAFRAGWSARHNHNRASPPDMARHLEAWKQQAFNDARRNTK